MLLVCGLPVLLCLFRKGTAIGMLSKILALFYWPYLHVHVHITIAMKTNQNFKRISIE